MILMPPWGLPFPPAAGLLRHAARKRRVLLAAAVLSVLPGANAQPAQSAQYVGSQTCQPCHEDIYNTLLKSPHALAETAKKRSWEGRACEACHGPGSKHAESVSRSAIRQPAHAETGAEQRRA